VVRLNQAAGRQPVAVSNETLEVLMAARMGGERTGGKFDITFGALADIWKFDHDQDNTVPNRKAIEARLPFVDFRAVRVDAVKKTAFITRPGVRVHLGGIGKGYAVDLMADLLREWGIDRALVHGGFSSVLALGPPPGREGWPLTLSAPWPGHEEVLTRIEARGLALSASGTKKGDHIVDPTTGRAAERRAVWVAVAGDPGTSERAAAPTFGPRPSAVAEGLSTAFMVLPLETVASLARQWPEVEAWIARGPEGEGAEHPGLLHLGRLLA
jgi:thiamine biosynthesis lipoprotein